MEAAIRFSQNSLPGQDHQHFLKIDIAGRSLQLYNIERYGKHSIKYKILHSSKKLAPFRAFDWHPTEATLVAVGQTGGEACLVDLRYPDQKPASFTARNPRSCYAISLNISDWVAVGLDKARTDHGLYIWDINRPLNQSGTKSLKNFATSLHRIASGEHVTSLRFFQDHPQLLAAGVQGFIRLYDLRDPSPPSALQFATKCVNNIAVDGQDENYFASCLPSKTPTVAVWDRRMITRTNATHFGFTSTVGQAEQPPEVSVELGGISEPDSHIFGLRFSKTHRGHLGVLSSTGRLKIVNFHKDDCLQSERQDQVQSSLEWDEQEPQDISVDNIQTFANPPINSTTEDEMSRLVSFDFTTATSRRGQPTIITLDKGGQIAVRPVTVSDNYASLSPTMALESCRLADMAGFTKPTRPVDEIEHKGRDKLGRADTKGPSKSKDPLLVSRQRCLNGYLLNPSINRLVVEEDPKLVAFWSWVEHAKAISANNALTQGEIDLSYLGVCDLWREEIDLQARFIHNSFKLERSHVSTIIRDTTRRLDLNRGKGCSTDYPQRRTLCLHVLGLPWLRADVQKECDGLLSNGEPTKAAAIALFAGEEKLAQKLLRSPGSGKSHKMLAMALMSSRNRFRRARRSSRASSRSNSEDSASDDSQDEEWRDIISAVAEDLVDCYAKSILAYVRTKKWEDVISQQHLPLVYRVLVALRHCDDTSLTALLPKLKEQAISSGNLEGIVLTGLGTIDSVDLLTRNTMLTGDVQTAALAMSFGAACDRFLPPESSHARTVHCFREVYKSQLMSLGLKFDKARFDIAASRAMRECKLIKYPRKEQIRLICSYCSQSISQFGRDQETGEQEMSTTETTKHPLAPAKAAVAGVICPRCGRHLPRCGVCDMWLGIPDESFSKWYRHPSSSSHGNSNNADPSGSMVGSTVTAIGPGSGTPRTAMPGARKTVSGKAVSKKLATADLEPNLVEVVDGELVEQQKRKKWYEAMHRLTVFCMHCSHGFHAEHAKLWFEGSDGIGGHRFCPVPQCDCICNA